MMVKTVVLSDCFALCLLLLDVGLCDVDIMWAEQGGGWVWGGFTSMI